MGVAKGKSKTTGKAASRLARPAIQKFLKGRKLQYVPRSSRPKKDWSRTSGFTDVPGPTKKNGKWVLNFKRHHDWKQADYDYKVDKIKKLGKDGKLSYTTNTGQYRTGAQGKARKREEEEIYKEAAAKEDRGESGVQQWLENRLKQMDQDEADHIQELQLGGKDSLDNLKMIDGKTNHGMGGQIKDQIDRAVAQGMKPGDRVEFVELPGLIS
jgi:hypothetical protein